MKYLVSVIGVLLLVGCVQSPTRTTQTVDDRPGLAFSVQSKAAERYELTVDGVSYGAVGQYLEGENLLRLVDGTHRVELISGGRVVLEEKVYLGANTDRIIKVGAHE